MLFGKKYAFNRTGAVQTVSKFLEKTATAVANMDGSNKPMGERLENVIADMLNRDEDIQIIMRRLSMKFGIDVEMVVVPKFNDATLMIEKYILAVPNSSSVLTPAVEKKDMEEMYNYLTQVALTNDEALMKGFCAAIEKAVNGK